MSYMAVNRSTSCCSFFGSCKVESGIAAVSDAACLSTPVTVVATGRSKIVSATCTRFLSARMPYSLLTVGATRLK